jgi:proteasome lid subunit RPN8/RPN11
MEYLNIHSNIYDGMRRHVTRLAPQEACGLLAGKDNKVEIRIGVANVDRSPVRFRMDPRQQWRAFQRMETAGLELLAIYHSHPNGPDKLSEIDIAEAMYPVVQILWYRLRRKWLVHGFHIDGDEVKEVTLKIAEAE